MFPCKHLYNPVQFSRCFSIKRPLGGRDDCRLMAGGLGLDPHSVLPESALLSLFGSRFPHP